MGREAFFTRRGGEGQCHKSTGRGRGLNLWGVTIIIAIIINSNKDDIWDMKNTSGRSMD